MTDAASFVTRARAAVELRRWDTVVAEASRAISTDPGLSTGYALLAQGLHGKRALPQALAASERGLAIDPETEWLHRLRGVVLLDLGRQHDALDAIGQALQLEPGSPNGYALRARAFLQLGDLDAARADTKRALELAPAAGWIHRLRADIELCAGDARAAELGYRAALRSEPDDAVAINNLGVALQRQGRHDEAVLAFKTAMLADPTFTTAKRNTHSSVKNLTRAVVTGAIVLVIGVIRIYWVGTSFARTSRGSSWGPFALMIAIAVAGSALIVVAARLVHRARAWTRVQQLDPQLWQLYKKLDRDHRKGRL